MIVRAIAMGQVRPTPSTACCAGNSAWRSSNSLVWGGLLGLISWWLYGSASLGLVMTAAMTLNLLLAALAGVAIPIVRYRFGGDPAVGSSVLITALTDSGGFFYFLGLATLFLV